jgi:hypothetical protein
MNDETTNRRGGAPRCGAKLWRRTSARGAEYREGDGDANGQPRPALHIGGRCVPIVYPAIAAVLGAGAHMGAAAP